MDERAVFEQFHEALELEPQPGAYERFRSTFINLPDAKKRQRPVFRLRFSKMGFRVAAVMVAVVVIAIAVVAGILATHHAPTSYMDANQQKNEQAYVRLMLNDYSNFQNATSNHCNTIDDQGCAAAVQHLLPSMRKWVADLAAFHAPAQYVVLDRRLRAHLNEAIVELNAAVAAQGRHDSFGFMLAMNAALYERAWIDPASFTLEGSYPDTSGSYRDAVRLANQSLFSCANTTPVTDALACEHIAAAEPCLGAAAQACADDIQSAETQLQNFIIAVAQNPPASAQAATDKRYEDALANADDLLLDMVTAQLNGDAAKISTDELAYLGAINSAASASQGLS